MFYTKSFPTVLIGLFLASVLGSTWSFSGTIGVAKDVDTVGRSVQYTIYVENLGTDDLTNLSIPDNLDAVFGAGNYFIATAPALISGPGTVVPNASFDGSADPELIGSGSLLVGELARIEFEVEITTFSDQGNGLGIYHNQVTATADDTMMMMVSDLSDWGTDPDPNGNGNPGDAGEDDVTVAAPTENPVIGIAKNTIISGNSVTIDFYLEAFGNVNLTTVSVLDDLDAVFGAGNYSITTAPMAVSGALVANPSFDGSGDQELIQSGTLATGATAQIQVVVNVDNVVDLGSGLGVYSNQVTATGMTANMNDTSDLSDNGVDPDPDGNGSPNTLGENDPTPIVLGEEPALGLAIDAAVVGSVVNLNLYLENLGNTDLSGLSLPLDFNTVFGTGNWFISTDPAFVDDPGTMTLDVNFDGNFTTELVDTGSLSSGDTAQISMSVTILQISDQGSGTGIYSLSTTVSGTAPGGAVAQDTSDDGTDPDPNANGNPDEAGENDPTAITVAEIASIGLAVEYEDGGLLGGTVPQVLLRYKVTNYGNVRISNVSITQDLNAVYGAGNFQHVEDPTHEGGPENFNYNTAFNGNSNTALLNGGSFIDPAETITFTIFHRVLNVTDQGNGLGIFHAQATLLGTDPGANPVSDLSQEGTDPDPDANGDPSNNGDVTVINVNLVTSFGAALDVSVAANVITFDVYVENLGTLAMNQIALALNVDNVFGTDNYTISQAPFFVDDPGTMELGTWNGLTNDPFFDIPVSSLAAGDTAQVRFQITVSNVVNAQGLGLGNYSLQGTINGISSQGLQFVDLTDFGTDPDPNGNGFANEAGEQDATTFTIPVDNPIGVALDAAVAGFDITIDLYLENLGASNHSAVDAVLDLDAAFGAGNYTITTPPAFIADPGTLTLDGAFDGSGNSSLLQPGTSTLAGAATAQIQLVVRVDTESDQGSGFGIYSIQATALGTQPSGIIVSDTSDDGTDPDPNANGDPGEAGEEDATTVVIVGNPAIGISKKAIVSGTLVTLEFTVENLGDSTLSSVIMEDPLNPVFGSGNYSVTSQPTLVSGATGLILSTQFFGFSVFDVVIGGGQLRPGESTLFRVQVNVTSVTDQGNGLGVYHNSVTVTANDPGGNPVSDISDDGSDPDPNGNGNPGDAGEDDTTIITIGDEAVLGVALDVNVTGQQVTFDYYLENFGGSALSSLALPNDLDAVFGAGNYALNGMATLVDDPGTIVLEAGFDGSGTTAIIGAGSTLASLDTAQIRLVVDVTNVADVGNGFGLYQNQVTASGAAPLGTLTQDVSDDGTDPDPNGSGFPNDAEENDPSSFSVGFTSVGAALDVTVNGSLVTFDYAVENLGTTAFAAVTISDNYDDIFGAGNYVIDTVPTMFTVIRNWFPNEDFDGSSDTSVTASGGIPPSVTEIMRVVVEVRTLADMGSGLGVYNNQFTVNADAEMDLSDDGTNPDTSGNGLANDAGEDDPSSFTVSEDPVIGAALSASVSGSVVTFDHYLESFGNVDLSSVSLLHDLNAAFGAGNYSISSAPVFLDDPGTLTLNGSFDGNTQTDLFSSGTLALRDTARIRFAVTVTNVTDQGSGLGMYSSQATASAQGPSGGMTSDTSDSGTDPDPDADENPDETDENDATTFTVNEDPVIGLAEQVSVMDAQVTFTFTLENFGNVQLGTFSLSKDLDTLFGAGNYSVDTGPTFTTDPGTLTLNAGFDGSGTTGLISSGTLAAGGLAVFTVVIDLNFIIDAGSGIGAFSDQSTVNADGLGGGMTSDLSDSGTDPDPNGNSDPTEAGENDATTFNVMPATIGDFVWNDLNGDGVQDVGEPGLSGVTVFIDANSNGSLDGGELSDTTDVSGGYDITGLVAGTYSVRVDLTTVTMGFTLTGGTNPNSATITTGEDFNTADFGFQQQDASIGDFVWNDLNGDGVQDAGEPGLSGVRIFLDLNSNGSFDGGEPNNMSGAGGAYDITNLATGTYQVRFDSATVTAGFVQTGGMNPFSVNLAAGEDHNNADFGFQQQDASIGDFVWNDLNGDGVQDGGEPGLSGVTVFLDLNSNAALDGGEPSDTTDAGGAYDITALATGTYSVRIDGTTVPAGFVQTGGTLPQSVPLAAGEDFNTADFGYQQQDATIGDFVWNDLNGDGVQDAGEPGISGVTVFLDLNSNGSLDGGEPSDTTDAGGGYDITNLATGTYSVRVQSSTIPTGFVLTGGTNPVSVNLAAGEDHNNADFGFQQQDARIGDFVWNDLNGDGVQDGGEPGLSGVTVFLDLNSNGTFDGGEPSDTSGAGGAYDIENLATGTYQVRVDSTSVPTGFVQTGGSNPFSVSLAAGEDHNAADFGFQQQDASIGDFIWNDLNGDGVQDAGEPGISGVTVFLDLNSNAALDGGEPSDTSDAGGAYDITDLATGTYQVRFDTATVPTGFVQTGGTVPQAVSLAAGEDFNTADFGFQQQDATIGDFVWNDQNGDGVQDAGEPGLAGLTVFLDLNSNGTLDGGEPSQTTNANGGYDFTDLATGTYSVRVDTSSVGTGFILTGGVNPLPVNLAAGEDFNDADFGYQLQNASVGDFIWNDLNGDGVQDAGEPGLAGVRVYLDLNENGVIDGGEPEATADGSGNYDITNLAPGTYALRIVPSSIPPGFVLTGGTEPLPVTITTSEDFNDADLGFQQQDASIGDFVWNDLNGDGVQDGGEPGLSGVTVFIDANENGVLDGGETSTATDGDGLYDFTDLAAGTYRIQVDESTVTTGFGLSGGTNPAIVNLAAGQDYDDADFGFQQQDASIGDFVWNDLDGDGVQDGGEPGLSGLTVFLDLNSNGTPDAGEPSDVTDASGAYDIQNLGLGTYSVRLDESGFTAGFVQTGGTNPVSVTIAAGEDFNDADFGFRQIDASIGDFVWNDLNGDGVQDAGEPGFAGMTVFFDDNENGSFDGGETSTVTDGDGRYNFMDLPEGTYRVMLDESGFTARFVQTAGTNPQVITLTPGEANIGVDFGFQQQDASLAGLVWNDLDGNGVQDTGEPGFEALTVFLDDNANGTLDGGEASTTTDADGNYTFIELPEGTYRVMVDESGFTAGFANTTIGNPIVVTLTPGETRDDVDFGWQQADGVIGGTVFNDLDGNQMQDPGETAFANVTLDLYRTSDLVPGIGPVFIGTATTDAGGAFQFDTLIRGNYLIDVTDVNSVLDGFIPTFPNDVLSVELGKGEEIADLLLGYCELPTIVLQPQDQELCITTGFTLAVQATSSDALTYQWRKDGMDLPGETGTELTVASADLDDSGEYVCVVSDGCGDVTSDVATVTVSPLGVTLTPYRAQGVVPMTLTADITCSIPPLSWIWTDLDSGMDFGEDENPVTLDAILTETTAFEITVNDDLGDPASATQTILVSLDPLFLDLNEDGCSDIRDMWALAEIWVTEGSDPNGDEVIDILDFFYINIEGIGTCGE
ncbi:Ig-like domain-containing protein [Sulfidibacter corallicola]|uniref:Ig-like domain-containing protein n=1 Tax=Sulfidibacter corallicola TaxID=2818388 RepID=A0A8A4TH08_SULCO|nr:SdrD B-like domain-containing protein [Sulfidibacter corallicola]QTD48462.1 hypothetical protein J3U87_23025 [Sulfidibacter corallicola]